MTEKIAERRIAKLTFEEGKYVARFNGRLLAKSYSKEYVVEKIRNKDCARAIELGVYDVEEESHMTTEGIITDERLEEDTIEFDINTRFEFLESLVKMIVQKNIPSLLITGEGGLGKTFTVKKVITESGLDDVANHAEEQRKAMSDYEVAKAEYEEALKQYAKIIKKPNPTGLGEIKAPVEPKMPINLNKGDFIFIKGYSTAKALYRILYENRNKICIFDDCDSIQKDANAINLIKAAADSYDERWVSWYSENPFSDLPRSFKFEGQIIFISNLSYHHVDQAIRSRSMCVDLSMTVDQKVERMAKIVESDSFMPSLPIEEKREALEFLKEKRFVVRDLTLRSLISVAKIRNGGADNWKQLAEYIVRTN